MLQSACVLTRSHAVGMWQALLEEGVLNHGELVSSDTVNCQVPANAHNKDGFLKLLHALSVLLVILLNAHVGVLCYLKYFF